MSKTCEFLLCNNHEGSIPSSRTKYLQANDLRIKNPGNSLELQRKVTTKSRKNYRTKGSIPNFKKSKLHTRFSENSKLATSGGGLGNSGKVGQAGDKGREMETGHEIVQTREGCSRPDGGDVAIRLDQSKAPGFGDSQSLTELGTRIPQGREVGSGFGHKPMNPLWCSCEKEKPGGIRFALFHGNGKVFGKLEAAIVVVRKENQYHGFCPRKGCPRDGLAIHSKQDALVDDLPGRLIESLQVGRG